ncbi:type II secretion system protein [bacterium]|nr:type II secretion system protein [bacterium]
MRRTAAFTLIELLVVIAVIMILASLTLPVIDRAMVAARKTTCMNNTRQIHIAVMTYVASANGLYPALDQSNYVLGTRDDWNVPNQVYNFPFRDQLWALDTRVLFCPFEPDSEWHRRWAPGHPFAEPYGLGYSLWSGRTFAWYVEQVGEHLPGSSPANAHPNSVLVTDIVRNWCGTWVREGIHMNNHYGGPNYAPVGGHACFADGHTTWTSAGQLDWERHYNNWNRRNTPVDPGWNFCLGFRP